MPHKPLNNFAAISFDIGGTLIEPFVLPTFEIHKKFIHQVCGISFSDEEITNALDIAEAAVWKMVPEQDVRYFFSEEDWIERNLIALKTLGISENLDEYAIEIQTLWNGIIAANPYSLKPDAKDTLEQLKHRGYSLGVATNWSNPGVLFESFGITDLFQSIQHSIVPGYCKPSPYMLIQNAHEMGVNPLKCAFIGDDIKRDVPAATKAGMYPILIVNEEYEQPQSDEDLTVIHELKELLDIFE